MGVPSISENSTSAAHGDIADYRFDWSNQSAIARAGAVACHKVGGNAEDIVLYGETAYGEVIGPILSTSKDPTLTDYLPTDGTGCCGTSIGQRPGRTNFIAAANSGAIAVGDFLIPTGAVGAVIPRPAGSNVAAVAKALQAVADSSSERYVFAEMLTPGGGRGGQRIQGFGADAPTTNHWLTAPGGNHAAAEVVLGIAEADGFISNLEANTGTAPGAGDTVTYTVWKGVNIAGLAATALTCGVSETSRIGEDKTHRVAVSKGDVFVIKVTTAAAGAAASSAASFTIE